MCYLFEKTEATGSAPVIAVWAKDNINVACSSLYSIMSSATANENVNNCLCMILDERGGVIKYDYWERSVTV